MGKLILSLLAVAIVAGLEYILLVDNFINLNIPPYLYHLLSVFLLLGIGWYLKANWQDIISPFKKMMKGLNRSRAERLSKKITKLTATYNKIKPYKKLDGFNQTDLTPTDSADAVYDGLILDALKNDKIKNIAITGPVGSGKSSMLEAFKKQHPEYTYQHVSLNGFSRPDTEAYDAEIYREEVSRQIEVSILQQLIYPVKREKIPETRFQRIGELSTVSSLGYIFHTFLWFVALLLIFQPSFIQNTFLGETLFKLPQKEIIYGIALFVFIAEIVYGIRLLTHFLNRSRSKKVKEENEYDLSVFNKQIDEILYYFETTGTEIVIFEDLDSFNNEVVFAKLRELNILLNKSEEIDQKIVFVYAIRDDLFTDKDKVRFFDYILPVIPYINVSNAGAKFIQLFTASGLIKELDKTFVNDISMYINDMRLLNTIYNEYEIYRNKLDVIPDHNKLLAIILYKNIYPADFAALHFNNSAINQVFSKKKDFIKQDKEIIENRIQELEAQIATIADETLHNERELRMLFVYALLMKKPEIRNLYINRTQSFSIFNLTEETNFNYLKNGDILFYNANVDGNSFTITFEELEKQIGEDFNYEARLANIRSRLDGKTEGFKAGIAINKQRLSSLSHALLSEIAEKYDIHPYLEKVFGDKELAKFLLVNGYIDEDYFYYISFFHEGDITPQDREFIKSVKTRKPLETVPVLTEIRSIIRQLRLPEFERPEALHIELLHYLLQHAKEYPEQLKLVLNQLKQSYSIEFIIEYLNREDLHPGELVNWLCDNYNDFWNLLLEKGNMTEEKQRVYLKYIFENASMEGIYKQNDKGNITAYLNTFTDFISYLSEMEDNDKMVELIKGLNVCIQQIDSVISEKEESRAIFTRIYEGDHYEISHHNISVVLQLLNPETDMEQLETANYTTILTSGCNHLINYVDKNINLYTENVNISLDRCKQEAEEPFISLLNNEDIRLENRQTLIRKIETPIESLQVITNTALWGDLIREKRVIPTWQNLVDYWLEFTLDEVIVDYINSDTIFKASIMRSDSSSLENDFVVDFLSNDGISFDIFKLYFTADYPVYLPEEFKGLNDTKVVYLIKHHKIELSPDNYIALRTHAPAVSYQLILEYIEKYRETYKDYNLSREDVHKLLDTNTIEVRFKIDLIRNLSPDDIEDDLNFCNYISGFLTENKYLKEMHDELVVKVLGMSTLWENKINILLNKVNAEDFSVTTIEDYLNPMGEPYDKLCRINGPVELDNNYLHSQLIKILNDKGFLHTIETNRKSIVVERNREELF